MPVSLRKPSDSNSDPKPLPVVKSYETHDWTHTDTVTVLLPQCMFCNVLADRVILNVSDYAAWLNGDRIQNVFWYLNSDQRELLKSGIHPDCWEKHMSLADEDEREAWAENIPPF